ncbi:MAG: adenylate/guanylate cyclase domain-containing protein, partial [Planctomycetota bacterium]
VVAAPVLDLAGEVAGIVYGSRQRGTGSAGPEIRPLEAQVVQVLAAIVAAGLVRQEKEAEALRLRFQFEQFFSRALAEELERDPQLLEGREREVTILFSDLRDFSRLSETMGPQELFALMQDVMDFQTEEIRQYGGVIVDYYGDGLLAMWNSPQEQPDHAAVACRAALAIRDGLAQVSAGWEEKIGEPLRLGIGLNTGQALVGNTGSKSKFKYGPMGPTVNLASRVEDATKSLGVPILVTGSTRRQLNESFATRRLCTARLAGVAEGVDLHELHSEGASPEWLERRTAYETALEHFESRRWGETCQKIYPLLQDLESKYDVPSLNLLSRAVDCLKHQPEHFDPCLDLKHPGGKAK